MKENTAAMSRTLKIIAAFVVLILVLLIGLLLALPPMVNRFKPEIEQAVLEQTGLTLRLQGDIGISLYPFLGVTIADVEVAEPNGTLFAAVKEVRAAVAILPLLGGALQVDKVIIDAARLHLAKDAEGHGNWEIVARTQAQRQAAQSGQGGMSEGGEAGAGTSPDSAPAPVASQNTAGSPTVDDRSALPDIDIALVRISDTEVSYRDAATGQAIDLQQFNLNLEDIRFDEFFPLTLSFVVANQQPAVTLTTALEVDLKAARDLRTIAVKGLDSTFEAVGEATANQAVKLGLAADAAIDLANQQYRVDGLDLRLDRTQVKGSTLYDGASRKATLDLRGTEFDLADYDALLAASGATANPSPSPAAAGEGAGGTPAGAAAKPAALPSSTPSPAAASGPSAHPFELLRTLNLAANLAFGRIALPGHRLENIDLAFTGSDGLLSLSKANVVLDGEPLGLRLTVDTRQQPVDTLKIDAGFSGRVPDLGIDSELSTLLTADAAFTRIALRDFRTDATLKGKALGEQAAKVGVRTQLNADLAKQSLQIQKTSIAFNNLHLDSDLRLDGFKTPRLSGTLNVADFSVRQLLESLGMALPPMASPTALSRVGLSTRLDGPANVIQLDDLRLRLDKTQFNGKARVELDTRAVSASLAGDRIVVDDYLPPPSAAQQEADLPIPLPPPAAVTPCVATPGAAAPGVTTPETAAAGAAATDAPLLPLEALRQIRADLEFRLKTLVFKEYQTDDMEIVVSARDGLIELRKANASLYDGTVVTAASLDARSDVPVYQFTNKVTGVNADKFPKSLVRQEFLFGLLKIQPQGKINLSSDYHSAGNTLGAVIDNARATMDLYLEKGAIEELKTLTTLYQLAARFGEDVGDVSKLVASTPFKDLQTDFSLEGSKLKHNQYALQLNQDADLQGSGSIDLLKRTLKYDFRLQPTEAFVAKGNKWASALTKIPLNYTCTADLFQSPVPSCGVDNESIEDAVKQHAEDKLKAKASEKLDRLLEKKLPAGDAKPEEQKTDKEKQRDALKDAGKNLLKGLLQ